MEEINNNVESLNISKNGGGEEYEDEQNLHLEELKDDISTVIAAQQEINFSQLFEGVWNLAPYLGEQITSEYYLCLMILKMVEKSQFNEDEFTQHLVKIQFKDGSWDQIRDINNKVGNLDTTIFHYWYLKTILSYPENKLSLDKFKKVTTSMNKAKKWILTKGGIQATQLMTKYKLAIFGQYSWEKLPYIPVFFFKNEGMFKCMYAKNRTPQWVYPHLIPLTYLRYQKQAFTTYSVADLRELWVDFPEEGISISPRPYKSNAPDEDVLLLIDEIFSIKKPQGSFGTYTLSTILSLICLRDFEQKHPSFHVTPIFKGFEDGFRFVEENYFNRIKSYGSVDDGRWWDTIVISLAMLEGHDEKDTRICEAVEKMVRDGLQMNKGIGYGLDFEDTPDTDDTALLLILLNRFKDKYAPEIEQTLPWLLSMQNDDGGYPAFSKSLTDNNWFQRQLYNFFGMDNSCEMFDPSCADITGHVLECLGTLGYSADHQVIFKMVKYIKQTQTQGGSWEARWGINHIYAVGSVIPGLARIHYDMNEAWVQKAIQFLLNRQNIDGGFGESALSFQEPQKWNGVGISTVTQTAWGLLALIECYSINKQIKVAAQKAARYLVKQFKIDGNQFIDHSVVGVGHRKILYLQFPSYSQAFPMLALARFRSVLNNSYHFSQNKYAGNGEMKLW